jgi:hypothetical protein
VKRRDLIWLIGTLLGAGALMAAFAFGLDNGGLAFICFGIASIIILALRDILEGSHKEKNRREAMRQAAARLGFSFRQTAPFNVLGWPESFLLTRDGMKLSQEGEKMWSSTLASWITPRATNVMDRSTEDAAVAVFDYDGWRRDKQADATIGDTVFAVRSPKLDFPHFALVPSDWWDRLVDQFRGNVALEDRYRVISENPGAAERFDERLFPLLDGERCLEAGKGFLLLYRRDRLVAPQDIDELVRTGMEVYSALAGATSEDEPPVLTARPPA